MIFYNIKTDELVEVNQIRVRPSGYMVIITSPERASSEILEESVDKTDFGPYVYVGDL